jgi:[ribosomal protein S18]-alanine N-acetyltransferase
VTRRLEPLTPAACALAVPLSVLHACCFPQDPWDPKAVCEILRMPGFFGRIAWEIDDPIGFALAIGLGKECEVVALGVVPERRRAGTGTALLESICSDARNIGAHSVVLEVAADNIAARALYARNGFVQTGGRRNYYRSTGPAIDALVLRRPLAAAPRRD